MVTDDRIRHLCDRVLKSQGAEFHLAVLELQRAIESRMGPDHQGNGKNLEK